MRRFFGAFAFTLCAALTMSFASCSLGSSDSEEKTGTTTITTGNPADSSGSGDSEENPETTDVTTESPETSGETPTVATYTVTFDSDGGSEVASQTVESGKTATKPADPTKSGEKTSYAFLGWYNGDSAFDFASAIKSNVTLKAKWLEGFVKVTGTTITGNENWVPASEVFVSGRSLTIGDLYVCDHEVTQAEYEKYCKYGSDYSPSDEYGMGDNYPAYFVNWYDAIVYCNLRSIDEGLTPVYVLEYETDPRKWSGIVSTTTGDVTKYCGPVAHKDTWDNVTFDTSANGYRLPTEAEWEYIARERKTIGTPYSGSKTIDDVAWYESNSANKSHEVKTDKVTGTDSANALGIYDMSGNVWEWCWDWYNYIYKSTGETGAAHGVSGKKIRVQRGGSWYSRVENCIVSYRYSAFVSNHYIAGGPKGYFGFRVVRNAE